MKTGQSSIPATGVTVVDSTKITCTFNLAGKTTGLWDVTIVNPDGQPGSLVEGFRIYDVPTPTPTPEGGGGGGDTLLPAQPGQYGSGMAIANEAPAGQTVSYSFGTPTKLYPVSIQSISFVPDKMVPQSQCLVQQQGPATAFGLTDRPVAYESIEIGWINPAVITSGKIHFSVLGSWLREKHIDPTNVVLLRSHDLIWTELPTTFDRMEGDNYYYNSDTPGFSYFAVSDRRTPAAAIATPQVTISRSAEIQPASPSVTATDIITSVPTKTQTPVPATPAPEAGSGSPVLYYLAGVVIVVVLVAGGFLIRRWWIRRQNPALFRELD